MLQCHLCLRQPIGSWTVANVVEWLAVVGLHRYAHIFRQHRVDGEALSELTSDALVVRIRVGTTKFYSFIHSLLFLIWLFI